MSEFLAAVKELLKDVLIIVLIGREVFAQRARGGHGGVSTEDRQGPGTATYLDLLHEAEEAIARKERLEQGVEGARLREERIEQEVAEAKLREERLEQEVTEAKLREERLEQEVEEARAREKRLEQEVTEARSRGNKLQQEVDEARLREERLQQEVNEARLREKGLVREKREAEARAAEAERWRDIHRHEQCVGERDAREKEKEAAATEACDARAALEKAEHELRAANEAREEAERNLRNGIRPIIIPTQEQWEATKRKLDYRQGFFHIAVAGVSGSGKSSLINAFRGLRNRDKTRGAAPVGITETTGEVTRYSDPDPERHLAWYDVPGAGTLDIPDWQYFTDQGLYVFNCILVVVDIRFTETDIAILRNCARFQIPSFIVRSKSSQHIRNMLSDMDSDEEDDAIRYEKACNEYNEETRSDYARILDRANLLAQRIYLVDKDVLLRVTRGESPEDVIDEKALCADMLALADPVAL